MTKIIQRHDTAANWTSINPVLAAGEMGVETDTNKFKFGDGVTAWSGLAYAAGEGGGIDAYTKVETDELLTEKQDKLTAVEPIVIKTDGTLLVNLETSGTIINNGDGSYTNPISNAGKTNWVKITPALDCIYTSDWEMIIPFKWDRNSNEASQTFIGGNEGTFFINIEDDNFRVWYNSSGYASTKFLPAIGIKTWIKLKYNGGVLQISFSTDGETYSNLTSHSRSTLSSHTETYFFGGTQSWQENIRGGMFTIFFNEVKIYKAGNLQYDGIPAYSDPFQSISANPATTSSLGVVQPDGTSITVSETGIISAVGGVQSPTIQNILVMTQAEYDALTTKDDTVLYLIREETV